MRHNTTANERIYIAAAACQRIRDSLISEPWSSKVRKELKSSALNDKRAFWANANVTLARLPVTVSWTPLPCFGKSSSNRRPLALLRFRFQRSTYPIIIQTPARGSEHRTVPLDLVDASSILPVLAQHLLILFTRFANYQFSSNLPTQCSQIKYKKWGLENKEAQRTTPWRCHIIIISDNNSSEADR